MRAELKFNCKNCIDDITLDVEIVGRIIPSFSKIVSMANSLGWSIGRDCYCPDCLNKLPAHCETCEHFEGNKSMGSMVCRKHGDFTMPNDYCKQHRYFHGYKEGSNQGEGLSGGGKSGKR